MTFSDALFRTQLTSFNRYEFFIYLKKGEARMRFRVNTNNNILKITAIIILITLYFTEDLHRMTLKPTNSHM